MEIKISEQRENDLFNRKEVKGMLVANISPSREQILEVLSKKFSKPKENIKIKGIHGKFGSNEFNIEANIYESQQDKDSVELKKKKEAEAEKRQQEAAKAAEEKNVAEADNEKINENVEQASPEVKSDETDNKIEAKTGGSS